MLMIQEILGYFLIGFAAMAIMAVGFTPLCFALRKRVSPLRQLAWFLFAVSFLVIIVPTVLWDVVSIISGAFEVTEHTLNLIPFKFITESWDMGARKQLTQTIANILMFMPLGFIFPVAFMGMRTFAKTTVCMLVFSFLIELVQYFIGRSADVDDLILNTVGGIIGYFIFYAFSMWFKEKTLWKKFSGIKQSAGE